MDTAAILPLTETIAPADQAEVADILRRAAAEGTAVYPIGGGTMGGTGILPVLGPALAKRQCHPTRPGIGLSTAKLNKVIDYPADDLTITVEAGITVAELNERLAANRQWLPVDVPSPERATVGGAIATNAAGPRRYAYGTIRDYLLGFTAVDGTGTIFSGGGRVVKNAAGYNMCRLMAGSRGTLGVITQATLMVRPLPESAALLACEVGDFPSAEKLLASLVRLPVHPVAVELSAGREKMGTGSEPRHTDSENTVPGEVPVPFFSRGGNPLFGPMLEESVARLYVGFEGPAEEVAWMLDRLDEEWISGGMTSPMLVPNLETDTLWRRLSEFPADERITVLPSEMIGRIVELLKAAPDCAVQAHAGDGIIRVSRGSRGEGREAGDVENSYRPEIRLMQAIKEKFDPKNILNPGRFAFQ